VASFLKQVQAGAYTGIDLDYEHPETWGPDFQDPLNATMAAELRTKYPAGRKRQGARGFTRTPWASSYASPCSVYGVC
jgi:hypothetical protein